MKPQIQQYNPNDEIDIINLCESSVKLLDLELYRKIDAGKDNIAKSLALDFLKYGKVVL